MQPKYDSTSSNNNANSVNNAISNSSISTITTTTIATRKPSKKSILVTGTPTTKMPFLAQKLESSKGTPSMNRTAANRNANPRDDDGE